MESTAATKSRLDELMAQAMNGDDELLVAFDSASMNVVDLGMDDTSPEGEKEILAQIETWLWNGRCW